MALINNWEVFYTQSKTNDCLVDQISIDVKNKRYILDIDVDIIITESCDIDENYTYSTRVSRFVFDVILKSVKDNGFVKYKFEKAD